MVLVRAHWVEAREEEEEEEEEQGHLGLSI
jgi:hypothetical protein